MYRVSGQTGQGFKAHRSALQSMRCAWASGLHLKDPGTEALSSCTGEVGRAGRKELQHTRVALNQCGTNAGNATPARPAVANSAAEGSARRLPAVHGPDGPGVTGNPRRIATHRPAPRFQAGSGRVRLRAAPRRAGHRPRDWTWGESLDRAPSARGTSRRTRARSIERLRATTSASGARIRLTVLARIPPIVGRCARREEPQRS